MMPTIRVDDEVFKALQVRAQPFTDTPNSVLRKLLGLEKPHGKTPIAFKREPLPRGLDGLVPINQLRVQPHDLAPARLRLPNGEERHLGSWSSLLLEVAKHLALQGKLSVAECPIQLPRARKRYMIHTQPLHPSGNPFFNPKEINKGLWIELNEDASGLRDQTIYLLERFREDPGLYLVELS